MPSLYDNVELHGHLIVGLPEGHIPNGWCVYAAPWSLLFPDTISKRAWVLFWVKHEGKECFEYYHCQQLVDPLNPPKDVLRGPYERQS